MAQPAHETPEFEVRCHRCNVSFPVGTKRCIHCGEKIGKPLFMPIADQDGVPILQPGEDLEEAEAAPTGGRWLRAGFTIFWLLLAFGSAAVRACQGE